MRTVFVAASLIAAVSAPQALAAGGKVAVPELKVTVAQDPAAARRGQSAKVRVTVAPPEGIKLNQYPGITLKVAPAAGLSVARPEAFVGLTEPLDDPEKFGFPGPIDPLVLDVKVDGGAAGTRTLDGTIKFFFCVKASGYCAPGEMKVKLPVKVGG